MTNMKPYVIIYRKKGIADTLSRIVKANNEDEAIYLLKLKLDPDQTYELSIKDVRLQDYKPNPQYTHSIIASSSITSIHKTNHGGIV